MSRRFFAHMKIVVVLVTVSLFSACCHYPKGHVTQQSVVPPPVSTITVVAYGDTRTGPWGLGDNAKQAVHGKVVDDILQNDGSIDAVIFTGDAVMTNFPLWKKAYWRCFLSQCNRFRNAHIPFYPSIGNHEVLPPIVPLIKTTASSPGINKEASAVQDRASQVAGAYEEGEASAAVKAEVSPAAVIEQVDLSSKQGRSLLKQWESGIAKGDAPSARKFGQFEGQLQRSFYEISAQRDERCQADAKLFSEDYLKRAKYEYLRPLIQGRSYYSKVLENGSVRVKLIALDTNCLDSKSQQDFFAGEVKSFDGPIVIFGHHPPVDYEKPGASWDLVPGWGRHDDEVMKRYFSYPEGSKIVLWIFGHVHDYQRRGPTAVGQPTTAPVMLVAGGGGASLDQGPAGFQWQPSAWSQPFSTAVYNQVKLSITSTAITVEVRGTGDKAADFKVIDSFTIPLLMNSAK